MKRKANPNFFKQASGAEFGATDADISIAAPKNNPNIDYGAQAPNKQAGVLSGPASAAPASSKAIEGAMKRAQ